MVTQIKNTIDKSAYMTYDEILSTRYQVEENETLK